MKSYPDIDNLIYRARHEAPCLIKTDLMRLILDMASALEFCKSELSFAKDKLGAANRQLFQGSSEAVPEDKKSPKPAAEKPALSDSEEESKSRIRDLRAEARRLARDLKEQSTPSVDKMAHEQQSAEIPQGIICPECRGEIKDQGKYREAVEIDVHPSRFVKRTVNLHKGSCSCGSTTLRMPAPIRAAEGSKFSPRFVSRLALDKFDMSLPLYRQQRMMSYEGLDLDRSTLNRALERHSVLLGSLAQRIHELNLKEDYLNVDESPLRHFEGGQRKTSFLFSFVSDKAVSYQIQDGRNRKIVADLIGSGPGVLQTDGLNIYDNKLLNKDHAGCLAHLRRYFFHSLLSFPKQSLEVIKLISDLYRIEHRARANRVAGDQLLLVRDSESRPIMDRIKELANSFDPPPRSTLGKAIGYLNRHWEKLCYFLKDPKVWPDNNRVERALRLPKLCQKNHLFTQARSGSLALEVYYTIIATCRLYMICPEDYLTDITIRLNEGHPISRLDSLLPWNWQAAPPNEIDRIKKYVRYDKTLSA
jgi:transposase